MAEEWLTVRQAADLMGRGRKWVYQLIDRNDSRLVVEKRDGWPFRILKSSVVNFEHRPPGNPSWQTKTVKRARRSQKTLSGPLRSAKNVNQ